MIPSQAAAQHAAGERTAAAVPPRARRARIAGLLAPAPTGHAPGGRRAAVARLARNWPAYEIRQSGPNLQARPRSGRPVVLTADTVHDLKDMLRRDCAALAERPRR